MADETRAWSVRNKYRIAGEMLSSATGSVIDIGARDGILKRWMPSALGYRTADRSPGCDLQIDLEQPLPFSDRSYDHAVALDILEHLENPRAAFRELARVTSTSIVIALPNLAAWRHRLSFLLHGRLATGKYDLAPTEDRHRWVTVFPEIREFVAVLAAENGWRIRREILEVTGSRLTRAIAYLPASAGLLPASLFAERAIYLIERAS